MLTYHQWDLMTLSLIRVWKLQDQFEITAPSPRDQWFSHIRWVGAGGLSKVVVATFNHVGRSLNLFMAITRDVYIIPSFRIWDYVLHVEHVSCVIANCGQHQCMSHPFSSVNSSLGFAGGKHYQKITIPIFRLVLLDPLVWQNFSEWVGL